MSQYPSQAIKASMQRAGEPHEQQRNGAAAAATRCRTSRAASLASATSSDAPHIITRSAGWSWLMLMVATLTVAGTSHAFGFSLSLPPPPTRTSAKASPGLSRTAAPAGGSRSRSFMFMSSSSQSDPTPAAPSDSSSSSSSSLATKVEKNDSLAAPQPDLATTTATTTTTPPAQPVKKKLQPLGRYLEVECWKRHELRDLEPVLTAVGHACKQINRIVQRAQTDDLYGAAPGPDGLPQEEGVTNVQGEVQQKLDVVCNTIMLRSFCGGGSGAIAAVASEEEDEPRSCVDVMMWNDQPRGEVGSRGQAFRLGNYVAVFDPIDGSANIDSSLPVGTVFGIYRAPAGTAAFGEGNTAFLQRGDGNLVAAGYCLYSATTVLVLTLGSGVDGFTLDPDYGTFLHTHRDVRIPAAGGLYSFNEANFRDFSEPVRKYLDALRSGSGAGVVGGSGPTARYVGALVADVHNVLMKGGIYGYPATKANPEGKLRLLYECCPMAMIMEQAGGAASTGRGRILDVQPREIHQRVPVFLGSIENVYELDQFHRYYSDDDEKEMGDVDDDYLIQHVA